MEIVVDNLVPILQVQSFRQNIGSDEHGQLGFAALESVFRIRFRREPSHRPFFASVSTIDYINIVSLGIRVEIFK